MTDEAIEPESAMPADPTAKANQSGPPQVAPFTAAAAELDHLLGVVRAAVSEAEAARKTAGDHAIEAELARKRAVEHEQVVAMRLKETADSADRAGESAKEAAASAKAAAKRSEHVQGAVDHADQATASLAESLKVTTSAKETAQAAASAANALQSELVALLDSLQQQRRELSPLADQVNNTMTSLGHAMTSITQAQAEAAARLSETEMNATKSAEQCAFVSDGKAYIAAERTKITDSAAGAQSEFAAAHAASTAAAAARESADKTSLQVSAVLAETTQLRDNIQQALKSATADAEATAKLAALSGEVEQRVTNYEQRITDIEGEFAATREKILGLLPAATSTGLAAAFHDQRTKYTWPRRAWTIAFFVAILGLITIGGLEIAKTWSSGAPGYDDLLRSLLARLPIVAGLLWLGLLAASRSRMAGQIEETYAHKEAVSRSFEGYKRELASLAAGTPDAAPVVRLCERVIETISTPPSHIYDSQRRDPTPMSASIEAVGPLLAKVNELVETIGRIKR